MESFKVTLGINYWVQALKRQKANRRQLHNVKSFVSAPVNATVGFVQQGFIHSSFYVFNCIHQFASLVSWFVRWTPRKPSCSSCCAFGFLCCQASLTKLSSIFTLKLISAFNALNTLIMVSIVALLALLSSLEI